MSETSNRALDRCLLATMAAYGMLIETMDEAIPAKVLSKMSRPTLSPGLSSLHGTWVKFDSYRERGDLRMEVDLSLKSENEPVQEMTGQVGLCIRLINKAEGLIARLSNEVTSKTSNKNGWRLEIEASHGEQKSRFMQAVVEATKEMGAESYAPLIQLLEAAHRTVSFPGTKNSTISIELTDPDWVTSLVRAFTHSFIASTDRVLARGFFDITQASGLTFSFIYAQNPFRRHSMDTQSDPHVTTAALAGMRAFGLLMRVAEEELRDTPFVRTREHEPLIATDDKPRSKQACLLGVYWRHGELYLTSSFNLISQPALGAFLTLVELSVWCGRPASDINPSARIVHIACEASTSLLSQAPATWGLTVTSKQGSPNALYLQQMQELIDGTGEFNGRSELAQVMREIAEPAGTHSEVIERRVLPEHLMAMFARLTIRTFIKQPT